MNEFLIIAKCTITEVRRGSAFKILILIFTAIVQFTFVTAIIYQHQFTARSATLGYNNMEYLIGNIDLSHFLLLQLLVIAVAMIFAKSVDRSSAMESVQSKQYSEVSWNAGTLFGMSILVVSTCAGNLLLILAVLVLGGVLDMGYGSIPELMSCVNLLLIDIPVNVVFYFSLVMLLQKLIRQQSLVAIFAIVIAMCHLALIQAVSFAWREVFSYSTFSSTLVSDILPSLGTVGVVLSRLNWILVSLGLLLVVALLGMRTDLRSRSCGRIGIGMLVLGMAGFCAHGYLVFDAGRTVGQVAAKHKSVSEQSPLDLLALSGRVEIVPGVRLTLDVDLTVENRESKPLDALLFSLNPGMRLDYVGIGDSQTTFVFEDGLVEIPLSGSDQKEQEWTVSIQAEGDPDVYFGYPEPVWDYLRDGGVSGQAPKLLGIHNSIFDHRFVALMPGSRWYPVPVESLSNSEIARHDTHQVDVVISVKGDDWTVAGPGKMVGENDDWAQYDIKTEGEIQHFAIIASLFSSTETRLGATTIESLVHKRHARKSGGGPAVLNRLVSHLPERIVELKELGYTLPYHSLTLVEVPTHLRLVGGLDMPFLYSLPGIVLVRESGFPTTDFGNIRRRLDRADLTEEERELRFAELIEDYDYWNILGGNLLEAVIKQFVPVQNRGDVWESSLFSFFEMLLITEKLTGSNSYYNPPDIQFIQEVADMTIMHPIFVLDRVLRINDQYDPANLRNQSYKRFELTEEAFLVNSMSVSEILQSENSMLRSVARVFRLVPTYWALEHLYDTSEIVEWIRLKREALEMDSSNDRVLADYRAGKDDVDQMIPLYEEWIQAREAPSFKFSELELQQVFVEDTSLKYKATFYVRNDSDVNGLLTFAIDGYLETVDTNLSVVIPGRTSRRIHLYSEEEIFAISIYTFFSKRRGVFLEPPDSYFEDKKDVVVEEQTAPLMEEASWIENDHTTVVVDNLDGGFSLIDWEEDADPGLFERIRWPWQPARPLDRKVKGMWSFDWIDLDANSSWRLIADSWAPTYGRDRNSAVATTGGSVEVARFSADIPISGKWSLEYYFPESFALVDRYGVHNFVIRQARLEHSVQVGPSTSGEWVHLGNFELSNSTVELDLISVKPSNAVRIADAIRWKLVEVTEDKDLR